MYYVYVLKLNNGHAYIGFTKDLIKRIKEHNSGKAITTAKYLPLKLVYYEAYLAREDAIRRERMIKRYGSTWSHLKKRLFHSLKDFQGRG